MPRYIIHIGPPKTATTYLQANFTSLAPWLAEQGVLYPTDLGAPGHARLPQMLSEPDAEVTLKPIFAKLNSSGAHTVLISAEDLAALRRQGIASLRRLIGNNLVYIVYYCRRWSEMIRSRWGERVKHGMDITLADSIQAATDTPLKVGAINYDLSLARWSRAFGMAALRLVSLSVLADDKQELLGHFLQHQLGITLDRLPSATSQNQSLSLVDTEILRAFNSMFISAGNNPSSQLRRAYLHLNATLALDRAREAIKAGMGEIVFDETRPEMMAIHRDLYRKYAYALVPPKLDDLLFTPIRSVIRAPSQDYLNDAAVKREIADAYGIVLDASQKQARARPERVS